jgi:hypothetical protein
MLQMQLKCIVLMPGGIVVPVGQLDRLPVLERLVEEFGGGPQPLEVTVPEDMVGVVGVVAEFLRREPDEFVLDGDPDVAAVQRRLLDWLGVDVGVLRTARELREEIRVLKDGAVELMLLANVREYFNGNSGTAGGSRMTWVMRARTTDDSDAASLSESRSVLSEEARQTLFVTFNEKDPKKEAPYFPEGHRMTREGEVLHQALVETFPWPGIVVRADTKRSVYHLL